MHTIEPPLLSALMAKTGYFLLYWSMFEQTLGDTIVRARAQLGEPAHRVRGGLNERLNIWADLAERLPEGMARPDAVRELCAQALELREIRNLIAHGLNGGDAMPTDGTSGYIQCVVGGFEAPTGEVVRYSLGDLENFIQAADACRRGCEDISRFNYRL